MPDAQDYLNAKEKAQEIAEEVINLFEENKTKYEEGEVGYYSDQPSRMYAIYGGWGTGKTRVLEHLEKEILSNEESDFDVVWFRPWEYEDEGEKVDQKLLAKILEKSPEDIKAHRVKKSYERNFLYGLIFVIITYALLPPIRSWIVDLVTVLSGGISAYFDIIIILCLITAGILFLWVFTVKPQELFDIFRWLKLNNVDLQKAQEIFDEIKEPATKREKISDIIGQELGENQKIFIFVDDLDRCKKETVIELLEHTKHFYSIDQLLFVFAIDKDVTANYISNYYQYSSDEQNIKGYQYLDKIFVNSTVYKPIDLRRKFQDILRKNNLLHELNSTDHETYYQLIEFYANFNIRKIENLVDRFASIYFKIHKSRIVTWENSESGYITLDMIFRWCLIYEFSSETFESKEWSENRNNIYKLHKDLLSGNPLRSGHDKYIFSFNFIRGVKPNHRLPYRLEQIYNEPKRRFRREWVDKIDLRADIRMQLEGWGKEQDNEILDHFVNSSSESITIIND